MAGTADEEFVDPNELLEQFAARLGDRELRLFAVGSCRLAWHLMADERSRRAVEVAERYANGAAKESELTEAFLEACRAFHDASIYSNPAGDSARYFAACAATRACWDSVAWKEGAFRAVQDAVNSTAKALWAKATGGRDDSDWRDTPEAIQAYRKITRLFPPIAGALGAGKARPNPDRGGDQ